MTATRIGVVLAVLGVAVFAIAFFVGTGDAVSAASEPTSSALRDFLNRPIGEQGTGNILFMVALIVMVFSGSK